MAELVGDTGAPSSGSGAPSPGAQSTGTGSTALSGDRSAASPGTTDGTGVGGVGSEPVPDVPYTRFKGLNDKYDKLRWAEEFSDPNEVRAAVALAKWQADNPLGLYHFLESQLRAAGHLSEPVPPNGNGADSGPPGPDYQDPQTGLKVYSAERADQLARWYAEQAVAAVEQRIAPIEQRIGRADVHGQARAEASQLLAQAEQWPAFGEHRQGIFEAMHTNPRLNLAQAYIQVVVPALQNKTRQDLITDLEQKPAATTQSAARSGAPSRAKDTNRSFGSVLREELTKRGGWR